MFSVISNKFIITGCYKRSDKGESYKGPVWFAANGLRCLKWDNYPDNFCRNPFGMRKKPWCWTQFGKEDCDIDICGEYMVHV